MIPVSTLYDEYIDRPKMTEQKKPIWVYSSSPPQEGRNNNNFWASAVKLNLLGFCGILIISDS